MDPESNKSRRGKRNNLIKRDREQDEEKVLQRELLQVLYYPYETKYRRGQTRKMTLPPKGSKPGSALVWFCGIGGVEKGSQQVHDEA